MKFPLLLILLAATLPPAFAAVIPVRVATVEQTAHAAERQIPGRIEAIHTVELRARTEGVITRIHFRDGQYVKKGDVLFELDDAEPRAALRLAQAEVKSAEATLRQAQQQLSRFESLGSSNAISRHDVDNAHMQRDVASAALEQAKARLDTRSVTLNYTALPHRLTDAWGTATFTSAAWWILPAVCWWRWSSSIRSASPLRWKRARLPPKPDSMRISAP